MFEAEAPGRFRRDELRLVVAADPPTIGVDRDVDHEICADTDTDPAPGDGVAERVGQALLRSVLDGVQGVADRAAERGAPIDLEERRRNVRREADRRARGFAESRIELEMIRLLTLKTAWLIDTVGNKHARTEIASIKVAAPDVALRVLDRAIQVHGGGGVSQDFPLARTYAHLRTLRLADGPDEVHKMTIARRELRAHAG